jgi:hypothetical protein
MNAITRRLAAVAALTAVPGPDRPLGAATNRGDRAALGRDERHLDRIIEFNSTPITVGVHPVGIADSGVHL